MIQSLENNRKNFLYAPELSKMVGYAQFPVIKSENNFANSGCSFLS